MGEGDGRAIAAARASVETLVSRQLPLPRFLLLELLLHLLELAGR